jgi:hypothetical protein
MTGRGLVLHVFYVEKREAPGIFFEIGDRVRTRVRHPEAIHFELHQLRINRLQQVVIGRGIAIFSEFEVVVVIAELNAGFLRGLAGLTWRRLLFSQRTFPIMGDRRQLT